SSVGSPRSRMGARPSWAHRILGGHRGRLVVNDSECVTLVGDRSGLCPRLAGICIANAALRRSRSDDLVNRFDHYRAALLAVSLSSLLRNATALLGGGSQSATATGSASRVVHRHFVHGRPTAVDREFTEAADG